MTRFGRNPLAHGHLIDFFLESYEPVAAAVAGTDQETPND